MKNNVYVKYESPYMMSIIGFLLGLCMIIWSGDIISVLIQIIGWFLIGFGVIPILISIIKKMHISYLSILLLAIGVTVLIFKDAMQTIFMWLLGIVLILSAIQQINMLQTMKSDGYKIRTFSYFFPAVLLLVGILSIINPFSTQKTIVMLFGCSMIFYSITTLVSKVTSVKTTIIIDEHENEQEEVNDDHKTIEKELLYIFWKVYFGHDMALYYICRSNSGWESFDLIRLDIDLDNRTKKYKSK